MAFVPSEYSGLVDDAENAYRIAKARALTGALLAAAPALKAKKGLEDTVQTAKDDVQKAKDTAALIALWVPRVAFVGLLGGALYAYTRARGGSSVRNPWNAEHTQYSYDGKTGEYIEYAKTLPGKPSDAKVALVSVTRMLGIPL